MRKPRFVFLVLMAFASAFLLAQTTSNAPGPPAPAMRVQHHVQYLTTVLSLTSAQQQQATAIVADDSPHMLDAITAIIERTAEVDIVATASNGIGAIRAAQRLTPDLVVLDMCMPMMNGLEAALHIERRLPDTKILLVSADDDPELGLAALDCGADGFIWKGSFAARCKTQLALMFPDA